MTTSEQQDVRVCPSCGTVNQLADLPTREYRCSKCRQEMAHLDYTGNGSIRGVFGWLCSEGDVIAGRYRVKSVLGKGGFGATYLVEDLRLNGKRRALKEVPRLMFDEYETTLLSRLNHPAIPDIIDRTEKNDMMYLVLEFGGSRTLGSERKSAPDGRLPQSRVLPWMRQLCDVLIYLHTQDPPIIHRDLKPDNVLLDENGRIMLIDFGIAKESDPSTMTRTLGRAATHGFSPPEQAMGTGTDQRSDIYALAATIYALLTGKNPPAAHERIAGKDLVPPSQVVPGISPLLDQALLKALNLNVNHRHQSMREFAQALEAVDAGAGPKSQPPPEDSERTVAVSPQAATVRSSPSLKLPGTPTAPASGRVTPASIAIPHAVPRRSPVLPIAIAVAAVAALAVAGYLFWPKQEEPQPNQPVATQQPTAPTQPQVQTPPATQPTQPVVAPPPQPPAITAQPPATVAPATLTQPTMPVAPVAPPTPPQPVQTPVRAADFLKGREPDPVPAYEPPRTVEPRRATAPKPRREPSAASSSSGSSSSSEPVFTIQREGSRRTE